MTSSLSKVLRIVSYCLRLSPIRRKGFRGAFISHNEMSIALEIVCKNVQMRSFSHEYNLLSSGNSIGKSSSMLSLAPFIDEGGLIRVGGRLRRSDIPCEARHPILLPRKHKLTDLIIHYEHIRNLHEGLQGTISAVRSRFWPLSVRSTARRIIRRCITCFKTKPIMSQAIMSDLPKGRVTVPRPFSLEWTTLVLYF